MSLEAVGGVTPVTPIVRIPPMGSDRFFKGNPQCKNVRVCGNLAYGASIYCMKCQRERARPN